MGCYQHLVKVSCHNHLQKYIYWEKRGKPHDWRVRCLFYPQYIWVSEMTKSFKELLQFPGYCDITDHNQTRIIQLTLHFLDLQSGSHNAAASVLKEEPPTEKGGGVELRNWLHLSGV